MSDLLSSLSPNLLFLTVFTVFLAGFVKGVVGFAMPMVMISGLSTFLPAELALGLLIIPTLVSNGVQALRQGVNAALQSVRAYRVFLAVGLIFIVASAQLYQFLPERMLFLLIGCPVLVFSIVMLAGVTFRISPARRVRAEAVFGGIAGAVGGISGVWGPPTVSFLLALNTEKTEQMRVQGVIYGLGALALLLAHISSGVVNAVSAPLSLAICVPAMLGMAVGMRVSDRLDPVRFRRATLFVLIVASANLIRKGVVG